MIRIDLPGFGLTGPHPESRYGIEDYVRFVVAVLDELEIEQAYFTPQCGAFEC
ncbi:MAG: hypothetical protein HLUCCO02_05560 [Idiomarinaceae bacterium HL-53]|nr:MAG: hypothetical protein HLUCCO02_05560 [Idiomarinaceae bacterium HL-53]